MTLVVPNIIEVLMNRIALEFVSVQMMGQSIKQSLLVMKSFLKIVIA